MLDSPCYGCKERSIEPNCHSTCKPYLEFRNERLEISTKRIKTMQLGSFQREMQKKAILRKWRNESK